MVDFDFSPIRRTYDAVMEASSPGDIAVQMAFAAASIVLGWMLARAICMRVPASKRWKFGKGDFERVAFPLFALLLRARRTLDPRLMMLAAVIPQRQAKK